MLEIKKADAMTRLKAAVRSSQLSRKDYVNTAHKELHETNLTDADVADFLESFSWDRKLIQVVFDTKSITPEYALKILQKENFDEVLCISAGKAHCSDESFLITLLADIYTASASRAKILTQKFAHHLSVDGAICLHGHINGDPKISKILDSCIQKASIH